MTPTCCNFLQDYLIKQEFDRWLTPYCITTYGYDYVEKVKDFMCTPCRVGSDADIDYIKVDQSTQHTTLYVCTDFAKELYAPGIPADEQLMTTPTSAFDSCGFRLWKDADALNPIGSYTNVTFSSDATTTASDFLNSPGFKSFPMRDLGSAFSVEIVNEDHARDLGVGCFGAQKRKAL